MRKLSRPIILATAATVVVSSFGSYAWHQSHRLPLLEMYIFSLKSGRSIFIRTPQDHRILIDGGANSQVVSELTNILPFYSRRIDTVIATNSETKNISGLIDVINRYDIDVAYIPSITVQSLGMSSSTDMTYSIFLDKLASHHILAHEVSYGDQISFDGENLFGLPPVFAQVLFPASPGTFQYSKASSPELAMNISFGSTSVAFLGSVNKKVQKFISSTTSSTFSNSPILIVSHSAPPDRMSSELINKLGPTDLIYSKAISKVSSGTATNSSNSSKKKQKSYLSPAPKNKKTQNDPLVSILFDHRYNIKEVGTVKIVSDGKQIQIITQNGH